MTLTQAKLRAATYPTKENLDRVRKMVAERRARQLSGFLRRK